MFHCTSNVHILYLNNFLFQFFIFFICSTKVLNLYDFLLLSDICQLEMMSILSTSIPSICASVHPIPSIHFWAEDIVVHKAVTIETNDLLMFPSAVRSVIAHTPSYLHFHFHHHYHSLMLSWCGYLSSSCVPLETLVVVVVDIVEMYIVKVFYVWAGPCSYHSSGVQDMTTFEKNWLLAEALAKRWTRKCLFKTPPPIQIQYYKFQ